MKQNKDYEDSLASGSHLNLKLSGEIEWKQVNMDYYGTTMTLQEMIDNDMQTSFNEGLNTSGIIMRNSDVENSSNTNNLNADFSSNVMNSSVDMDSDISWLDSVNINTIQQMTATLSPTENGDHTLMVDPKTGAPVQSQLLSQSLSHTESNDMQSLNDAVIHLSDDEDESVFDIPAAAPAVTSERNELLTVTGITPIITAASSQTVSRLLNAARSSNQTHTSGTAVKVSRSDTGIQVNGFQPTFIKDFVNVVQKLPIAQGSKTIQIPVTNVTSLPSAATVQKSPLRQHLHTALQLQQPLFAKIDNTQTSVKPVHQIVLTPAATPKATPSTDIEEKVYPKPAYSYSCLIAMALKNSECGYLPVSEIYNFMMENFPYYRTAPDGWKNSVRHNLSLNKCFAKVETPKTAQQASSSSRKVCLWGMNPAKVGKMEEEIYKWRKKDLGAIKRSMAKPEVLPLLEKGQGPRPSPSVPKETKKASMYTITTVNDHLNRVNNNKPLTGTERIVIKQNPLITAVPTVSTAPITTTSSITAQPLTVVQVKPFELHSTTAAAVNGVKPIDSSLPVLDIKPRSSPVGDIKPIVMVSESGDIKPVVMVSEPRDVKPIVMVSEPAKETANVDVGSTELDPALNEFVIQSGIFDDTLDRFDDIPVGTSPLSLSFSSFGGNSNSPTNLQNINSNLQEVRSELSAAIKAQAQAVQ